jgi:hypothetical protein
MFLSIRFTLISVQVSQLTVKFPLFKIFLSLELISFLQKGTLNGDYILYLPNWCSFKTLVLYQLGELLRYTFCIYFAGDIGSETVSYTPPAHFVWLTNAE